MEKNVIAPNRPSSISKIEEQKTKLIQKLHRETVGFLVKSAKRAYEAGELLTDIWLNSTKEEWSSWVKNDLKISSSVSCI